MHAAAHALVGEHDFAAFRAAGCAAKTTLRRVESIAVTRSQPDLVEVDVRGNAFLRNMVRIIVGTLVEVGTGVRPVAQVAEILAAKDRGRPASPRRRRASSWSRSCTMAAPRCKLARLVGR